MTTATTTENADAQPKRRQRVARIPQPIHRDGVYAPADLPIPVSSLYALWAKGEGPKRFRLGRRVLVRGSDWHEWIDGLASAKP